MSSYTRMEANEVSEEVSEDRRKLRAIITTLFFLTCLALSIWLSVEIGQNVSYNNSFTNGVCTTLNVTTNSQHVYAKGDFICPSYDCTLTLPNCQNLINNFTSGECCNYVSCCLTPTPTGGCATFSVQECYLYWYYIYWLTIEYNFNGRARQVDVVCVSGNDCSAEWLAQHPLNTGQECRIDSDGSVVYEHLPRRDVTGYIAGLVVVFFVGIYTLRLRKSN